MKSVFKLESYDQLKTLSDPLRAKIMVFLVEQSYTGQQLAEKLEIPRAKIHYHLKELEKHGLIQLEHKEEVKGIVQKFYRSVAASFYPGENLLNYTSEIGEIARQSILLLLERTKARVLTAPSKSFNHSQTNSSNDWEAISTQVEVKLTKKQFRRWKKKYINLLEELRDLEEKANDDAEASWFYMAGVAFCIDEAHEPIPDNNEET